MEQEPAAKSGLFKSAPLVIGIVVVSFCVVSLGAGFAVGGAWYAIHGGKPVQSGAHAGKQGVKNKANKHRGRVENEEEDEEEQELGAATPAAAPAPGPATPRGRKLGGESAGAAAPTAGAPHTPAPAGSPRALAAPAAGGDAKGEAPAEPAAPVKRGRYSNSTPDPNAETPK